MPEWEQTTLGEVASIQQGKKVDHLPIGQAVSAMYGANGVIGSWTSGSHAYDVVGLGCRGSVGSVHRIEAGAWLGNNVMGVWPRDSRLTLGFLLLWLEHADLRASGVISGQVQPQITRTSLAPLPISFPPLAEQRRIVDVMAVVDAQIEALEAEHHSARNALESSRAAFTADIATRPLDEVLASAKAGGTPDRKRPDFYGGDIPWLKSGEVASSHIAGTEEHITEAGLRGSSAWLVPQGTVVVAMYGATAAQVGFTGCEMATNQAVLALNVDPKEADPRFLFHWMCARSADLKRAATGAAQPNLSKGVVLDEAGFPYVDLSEQRRLATGWDGVLEVSERLVVEGERLRLHRASLLSALLSQQVEIPKSYDALLDNAVEVSA